jgi:hypothetical protein
MVAAASGFVVVSLSLLLRWRASRKPPPHLGSGLRRRLSTAAMPAAARTADVAANTAAVPELRPSPPFSLENTKDAAASAAAAADAADAFDAAACPALEVALRTALYVSPAFASKRRAFRDAARRSEVAIVTDFDHTLTAPSSPECHDVLVGVLGCPVGESLFGGLV